MQLLYDLIALNLVVGNCVSLKCKKFLSFTTSLTDDDPGESNGSLSV